MHGFLFLVEILYRRISPKELELLSLRFDILPFPGLRDGFLYSKADTVFPLSYLLIDQLLTYPLRQASGSI